MSILSVGSFLQPLNNHKKDENQKNAAFWEEPATEKSSAFTLDLSDAAKMIMAAGKTVSQTPGMDTAQKTKTMTDLANDVKKSTQEVEKMLNRLLLSRNIDTSSKIEFGTDENGRIIVTSDHPDKALIEEAVNGNNEVSQGIKDMLDKSSTLALATVKQNYTIALEDEENKDDEEKKLMLDEKYVSFAKQVNDVSGNFSLEGGQISAASLSMAQSMTF